MIQDEFNRLAEKRVMPVSDDIPFHEVLPPFARARLKGYKKKKQKAVDEAKMLEEDSMACDLERGYARPGVSYGKKSLMTLVSHGTIWHDQINRCLVPEEWLSAHCVPTLGMPCGSVPVCADYMRLVRDGCIGAHHLRSMVGNGWHIGSVGSWLMYVLAVVEFGVVIQVPRNPWSDGTEERSTHGLGSWRTKKWRHLIRLDSEPVAEPDQKRSKLWLCGKLRQALATSQNFEASGSAPETNQDFSGTDEVLNQVVDLTDD